MLIYLASPYSHPDAAVREDRYEKVLEKTAYLMKEGWLVYSPIVYSHHLAVKHDLGLEWITWQALDQLMIGNCNEFWVLKLPGWEQSRGIAAEIDCAKTMEKPMKVIDL